MNHLDGSRPKTTIAENNIYHPNYCIPELFINTTTVADGATYNFTLDKDGCRCMDGCRIGEEGGGVALYIREAWKVKILTLSDPKYDNTPEFIIAEIKKG